MKSMVSQMLLKPHLVGSDERADGYGDDSREHVEDEGDDDDGGNEEDDDHVNETKSDGDWGGGR